MGTLAISSQIDIGCRRSLSDDRFGDAAPQRRRARRRSCVDGSCIARDFYDRDGLSVQSCVRPVYVTVATGPDEFRKRGSYRLNDLWGPRPSSECPCSWLTSFRVITSNVLHLWAGSSDRLPVFLSFRQKRPDDPGGFVGHGDCRQPEWFLSQ